MNHRQLSSQAARVRSQVTSHGSTVDKVLFPEYFGVACQFSFHQLLQIHYSSYHRLYGVSILTASFNSQLGEEKTIFAARETLKYLKQFHLFKFHRLLWWKSNAGLYRRVYNLDGRRENKTLGSNLKLCNYSSASEITRIIHSLEDKMINVRICKLFYMRLYGVSV
jgi:hypothetical protein